METKNELITLPVAQGSTFQFSAVRIQDLGSTEYTLATLVVDVSPSVSQFVAEIIKAIKTIVEACKKSPRADNLLLRVLVFNETLREIHGFKPLSSIDSNSYESIKACGSATALFDAAFSGIGATIAYSRDLTKQDYNANGITFIITDGQNNCPGVTPKQIAELKHAALQEESIESLLDILIGVNLSSRSCLDSLVRFEQEAELSQFIDIGEATPGKLAKLAQFVSKSISAQSQSLGTGGISKPVSF